MVVLTTTNIKYTAAAQDTVSGTKFKTMIYKLSKTRGREIHTVLSPKTGRVIAFGPTAQELAERLGGQAVSRDYMTRLIKRAKELGGFFAVHFIKRTNGEYRKMVCRGGVKKTKGGSLRYNPEDYGLTTVWDVHKRAYRHIPLDKVSYFKFNNIKFFCFE